MVYQQLRIFAEELIQLADMIAVKGISRNIAHSVDMERLPCLFGANTAAISVGRILPDISAERDIVFLIVSVSGNCCAFVMIGDSTDFSA